MGSTVPIFHNQTAECTLVIICYNFYLFIYLLQFNGIQTNNVYMNELALRAL